MDILTTEKALQLYDILGKHIPKPTEDETALQFIGKIVNNINDSKKHNDYVNAVVLMSGMEWDEIKMLGSDEILNLFIEGLSVNRIVKLKSFCDSIGYKDVS